MEIKKVSDKDRENSLDYKPLYKRRLPHIQPEGAVLFVTFRLFGSIPQPLIQQWRTEKEEAILKKKLSFGTDEVFDEIEKVEKIYFQRFDELLESSSLVSWLSRPDIAKIVVDAMHFLDGKLYKLHAFCIMPNHVHIVFQPLQKEGEPIALARIMHSLKRFTASKANIILGRQGQPFWQAESYDRVVRDQAELERIIAYVVNNPVKAGLVETAEDWPWSFYKS